MAYRVEVCPDDEQKVAEIVKSTGFFSIDEVHIACELVNEYITKGPSCGYHFLFAEQDNAMIGYTCFGPIPATECSFDLYWIAVLAEKRGHGLGRVLLGRTEEIVMSMGGRKLFAETAGREQYAPTRAFYQRCGYLEGAVLADYYAPGDAKFIYSKDLHPAF
ncbi:MAG: GNAT family N-acetyltransferase [Deltaproteobacteria bacterium]|nr:GNAT family N-acetyltransferase [Deltaproteobacteria bacterium]MBN2671373.1 GNAT family N-acetyltransferase [Deltaproteobacteria bacterium]